MLSYLLLQDFCNQVVKVHVSEIGIQVSEYLFRIFFYAYNKNNRRLKSLEISVKVRN